MASIRRFAPHLLGAWTLGVGLLTLTPGVFTPPLTLPEFLCVGCGWRDTADVIVNWALFVPGGALLALLLAPRRAVLVAAVLTAVVEILQIGIPGRDPALQDLLANTLGALSGVYVAGNGIGRRLRLALGALAGLAWLAPVPLLIPMTTSADLYGQWTPAFENFDVYRGRVLAASVGGVPVASRILPDKSAVDAGIVGRLPIEITLVAGPPPGSFSPVFQVVDSDQMSVLTLGASGDDLSFRWHSPSRILRLDQPEARWRGAMRGLAPGDTVAVGIERGRDSLCMSVAQRTRCGLAPSLGRGWQLLASSADAPAWAAMLANLLWCSGLGLVLGATAGSLRGAASRGILLAVGGYVASLLSPDVSPDLWYAGLLATGSVGGQYATALAAGRRIETIAERPD